MIGVLSELSAYFPVTVLSELSAYFPVTFQAIFFKITTSRSKFQLKKEYRLLIGNPDWKRPEGQVWHHHQEQGRMQLVDKDIHNNLPHCGGVACYN